MIKKVWLFFTITFALGLSSCEKEEGVTEYDRVSKEFSEHIGGDVDPLSYWRAAVTLKVNVKSSSPVTLWVRTSGQDEVTLFDMTTLYGSGTAYLTLPQGYGMQMLLMAVSGQDRITEQIMLTGSLEQEINIQFSPNKISETRAANDPSLYGNSISQNEYYSEVDQMLWGKIMEWVSQESVDQSLKGEIVNYEFASKGKFECTFLSGNGTTHQPRILGYYYHSPETYDDVTFVPVSETHIYDYLDGKAKVQYQLDGVDKWYDANYDMYDGPDDDSKANHLRRGDDAYNIILVWKKYGKRVTKVRGLTFIVDVPVGMHLGFFLEFGEATKPTQLSQVIQLGMNANRIPMPYTAYNFSAQAFNDSEGNRKSTHRSWYHELDNYAFMGMENVFTGGDLDCNDVVFGVSASDVEMVMPEVIVPDIDYMLTKDVTLPWTLSFEDTYRKADFDYNDAVIRLEPDFDNEKIKVTVLAAGTDDRVWLHYDGPNGDINLGEIHQILDESIEEGTPEMPFINTKSSRMSIPGVDLDLLPWPKTYNMYDDARRFYIEVQRGTCATCSDIIRLPIEPGLMPEVLLVPGEWRWPKEGNHIVSVYSNFPDWCADVMNTNFWNWHLDPKPNSYVNIR